MKKKVLFPVVLTLLLTARSQALAQSASDLLQQGIYTQETLGDIDGAIKIFQQIVAEAKTNRLYAAQAQYRLGLCYLSKGMNTEAQEAFKTLIKEFPDQKELVAKATEHVSGELDLLPVPWVEGEVLQLAIKINTGAEVTTWSWGAYPVQEGPRQAWQFDTLRYFAGRSSLTRVFVDRETFLPIRSLTRSPVLGNDLSAEYERGQVKVVKEEMDTAKVAQLHGVVYDNDQGVYVFRRLPLAVGYKTVVPVFTPVGGVVVRIPIEVTERTTIEVPAGKYECYKMELRGGIGQTMWFSTDPHRYFVKFEAGAITGELAAIRQRDPFMPAEYRDEKFGFTLTAPPGWSFFKQSVDVKENEAAVNIIDPDAIAVTTTLWVDQVDPGKLAYKGDIRGAAEEKITERKKQFKDYTVRADSWTERTVAGRPALGYTADLVFLNKKMVEYVIFVGGPSLASSFRTMVETDKADDFHRKFDQIVDGYTIQ
jgi:hypothetical protein